MSMKIRRRESGIALITALIVVVMVGGMAIAFLTLSFSQNNEVSLGSEREVALHIAEAGIEDAINRLDKYSQDWVNNGNAAPALNTVPADYQFLDSSNDTTVSHWDLKTKTKVPHKVDIFTGSMNRGTYSVEIQNIITTTVGGVSTTVTGDLAQAVYQGPFTTSTGGSLSYQITSAGTHQGFTRTIQTIVQAVNTGNPFKGGLFGNVEVDALGTFFSDGWNSKGGTVSYASQKVNSYTFPGGSTVTYANATGSIGSNGNIVTNGAVVVMGDSTPGPGGTSGPGGSVYGSTTPAIAPTVLNPVSYPSSTTLSSYTTPSFVSVGSGKTKTNQMNLVGGATATKYHLSSLGSTNGSINITSGKVELYVDGSFDMNNNQTLNIAAGAELKIYQGPGSSPLTINGQAIAGTGANASQFQVYSATTGTIKFNGGSTVYAAVYAPNASFMNNGGNEFFGAMVANTMKLTGTASFHYDENLASLVTPTPQFKIVSWVEMPNQ